MESKLEPVIEQFRALRSEIELRIKQHTQLVVFKISTIGVMLYFFSEKLILENPRTLDKAFVQSNLIYMWIIPLAAVVFDMLIAGNLRTMYNIGPYIMKYIEPKFRDYSGSNVQFWEETVASADSKKYYGYTSYDLNTIWIISLFALLIVLYVNIKDDVSLINVILGSIFIAWIGYCYRKLHQSINMKRKYTNKKDKERLA